jgi:hypothetical protein
MTRLPFAAAIAALAMTAFAAPAAAQNYPWCSNFADGAGTNCGFSTLQQCKEEIMGAGGYCSENNLYVPPRTAVPAGRPAARRRVHKKS